MLDFTVPNNPGWGKRVLAEQEEGHIGAISPKMLAAIDTLRGQQYHVTNQTVVHDVAVQAGRLDQYTGDIETEASQLAPTASL